MRSALLLPCFFLACAEPRPAPIEPAPVVEIPPPPTSTATAESAAPPRPSAQPMHGEPDMNASIGDVTCSSDADCVVTTKLECCACCAGPPRATSRPWLEWRDGTDCPKQSCKPCGKRECQSPRDPSDFVAVCDLSRSAGRCGLAPKL